MTSDTTHVITINPATGDTIERYAIDSPDRIDRSLNRAFASQRNWRGASFVERADHLLAIARELRSAREEASSLITAEMGKAVREARVEIDKCAWACEHYAEQGSSYLAHESVATEWSDSFVEFPPLGVVLAIMPWNYPFWQVIRAAAPAMMAGNTVVLKHASNVTGCALLLADIVKRATGLDGLLESVVVPGASVAEIIADRRIAAVTLTGSESTGISVALACARHLKKSVLELGGSDAFIVLEDADIEIASDVAVTARFQNAGQSCIAAKRFIVVDQVADEFEQRFAEAASALTVGDPRLESIDLGPMARRDLKDELADQVRRGIAAGGRLLVGSRKDELGAFHSPTVIADVQPGTPLFDEETFGPVAAVVRATDTADAIALANASPYGLSSSLWTEDIDRAKRLAPSIEAGAVFINAMSASDPRVPFGGIKRSGWGRELGSLGIREFVNPQSVIVAPRLS